MAASGGFPVLLLRGPVSCRMCFQRSAVLSSFCIAGAMPVPCDRTLTVLHLLICCQRLLIWQIPNLRQHPRKGCPPPHGLHGGDGVDGEDCEEDDDSDEDAQDPVRLLMQSVP
jgi:hypothetical protein